MRTHPIVEYYQALRDSAPCLSRAATLPKGTKLGLGKRRAPGNTIILSQPYRRRVSTDKLNREGSQLAASLEGEPGPTPAGKTLPHSFPETSRFRRERARDICVCNMEKHEEGRVDPEPDQLESPPAGTGFETPGQQCHSILETRRTTANGCLLVAVSSNFGRNTFSRAEIVVGRRADSESTTQYTASITASLQTRRKPKDKETGSEENKQFDPGGERRGATTLESGCTGIVFFPGGNLGLGARCLCFVLLSVRVCLYIV